MRAPILAAVITVAALSALLLPVLHVSAEGSALGDVNNDARVNSVDAFLVLGYHAGIIPPPKTFPIKGDVNEDGFVNAIDAILILQYHAGLLAALPPPA